MPHKRRQKAEPILTGRVEHMDCAFDASTRMALPLPDNSVKLVLSKLQETWVKGSDGHERVMIAMAPSETWHASVDSARAYALSQIGDYQASITVPIRYQIPDNRKQVGASRERKITRKLNGRIHAGRFVYFDGANLNARIGWNCKGYMPESLPSTGKRNGVKVYDHRGKYVGRDYARHDEPTDKLIKSVMQSNEVRDARHKANTRMARIDMGFDSTQSIDENVLTYSLDIITGYVFRQRAEYGSAGQFVAGTFATKRR